MTGGRGLAMYGAEVYAMSDNAKRPVALLAADAPARAFRTHYPEPFASRMAGRDKRPLGEVFGLTNFGVNLTRLAPGGSSALRHAHTKQDEFVYILEGRPTLVTDAGRKTLKAGICAGFKAGSGDAHCLVNETGEDVVYLEIGDRAAGDAVDYPDDDLAVVTIDGQRRMAHKDGTPY
ncbi:MAG: cupin domain-containing protein [Roseiarcus sp.]